MTQAIAIVTEDETIERFLPIVSDVVGADLPAYRNHLYRVLTYALHFEGPGSTAREAIAFALVFHDIGLWSDGALAYLEPSERVAEVARRGHAAHLDRQLIRDIIHWHHKLTRFRGPNAATVNAVRKADWIDASGGAVRHGISRAQIAAVTAAIPVLGFPDVLMRLAGDLNHGRKISGLLRVLRHVYKL